LEQNKELERKLQASDPPIYFCYKTGRDPQENQSVGNAHAIASVFDSPDEPVALVNLHLVGAAEAFSLFYDRLPLGGEINPSEL